MALAELSFVRYRYAGWRSRCDGSLTAIRDNGRHLPIRHIARRCVE
jgi:hypothetical protein